MSHQLSLKISSTTASGIENRDGANAFDTKTGRCIWDKKGANAHGKMAEDKASVTGS